MNNLPKIVKILIAVALCFGLGTLSGVSTISAIQDWYVHLNKPFFTPPNWLFGPAWTILYILIGVAAGLVWHKGTDNPLVKSALGLFVAQFILNLAWSPIFFGMKQPLIALVVIVLLWILILWTILRFRKVDNLAAGLMVPYLLWVTFATALNAAIVYLN